MNKLIIVRNGQTENNLERHLSLMGKEYVIKLAAKIAPFSKYFSTVVVSSPLNRTMDTARVLREQLGLVRFEVNELLWSEDHSGILDMISKYNDYEVVILVTDIEHADFLPRLYGKIVLGVDFSYQELKHAEALCINCTAKTCSLIEN